MARTKNEVFNGLRIQEYSEARKKFSSMQSSHEGYAIIKEEFEELVDEMNNFSKKFNELWQFIKADAFPPAGTKINQMDDIVFRMFNELVQLGAMIYSYNVEVYPNMDRIDRLSKKKSSMTVSAGDPITKNDD